MPLAAVSGNSAKRTSAFRQLNGTGDGREIPLLGVDMTRSPNWRERPGAVSFPDGIGFPKPDTGSAQWRETGLVISEPLRIPNWASHLGQTGPAACLYPSHHSYPTVQRACRSRFEILQSL